MRAASIVLSTALSVVICSAGSESSEGGQSHEVVVELGLRPSPNFDPRDPVVIESITNMSEQAAYTHQVPQNSLDRSQMGPYIRVDGVRPEQVPFFGGNAPYMVWGIPRELPPNTVREIVWRLRDKFEIPVQWSRLWVCTEDPPSARGKVWIELDRAGGMVTQGTDAAECAGGTASGTRTHGQYEVIERVELPVQVRNRTAEGAEKKQLRRKIVGATISSILAIAGAALILWWRRYRSGSDG